VWVTKQIAVHFKWAVQPQLLPQQPLELPLPQLSTIFLLQVQPIKQPCQTAQQTTKPSHPLSVVLRKFATKHHLRKPSLTGLSGYLLWSTELGGITPCYSTTSNYLTPPPIAQPSTTDTGPSSGPATVTSTVVNVVYAMNYPVKGRSGGLSKGADAGVGIGSVAAAALASSALLWFCIRRRRQREREEEDEGSPYSGRGRPQDEVSSPSTGPRLTP
jgi:hypothetical protein